MKDNPYSLILNTMQGKQDNQGVLIGLVTSTSPFTVKVGDLSVGKGNLLVADEIVFRAGNKVAVFPTNDRQMYLVLAKLKEV